MEGLLLYLKYMVPGLLGAMIPLLSVWVIGWKTDRHRNVGRRTESE